MPDAAAVWRNAFFASRSARTLDDLCKTYGTGFEVTVRTEVIVETTWLEVRLEREEYVIERRDLSIDGAPVVVTRIPLKHEEAFVQKRVVVTNEVVVRPERVVESSTIREDLRNETFRIHDGLAD